MLDTETTGLEVSQGNRIIEIGCVELIDRKLTRKHYHQYVNPRRDSEEGALEVHGITTEFLSDKPVFSEIWQEFFDFVRGAELVIHNAPFDLAFLNSEIKKVDRSIGKLQEHCKVIDSLDVAKQKHPGQKNNLDALCKRYDVDNSQRELHGALLDAEILADVYLLMTGGQVALSLAGEEVTSSVTFQASPVSIDTERPRLKVIKADLDELQEHEARLDKLDSTSGGSVWRSMEKAEGGE